MKNNILYWSIVSSLAGFIFGFDTIVISGAEQQIQSLWNLSPEMHGIAIASALYGTIIGSLLSAWPSDRFGRKKTLLWIGILYFVSAVWSGLAHNIYALILARAIGGLGIGISTVAAPLYIAEIAPPETRGRLTALFQFNLVFGILIAFISNYFLGKHLNVTVAWRWMLGVEGIPAIIYTLLCFRIPESPRWLIGKRGNRAEARTVLQAIRPKATEQELEAQMDEIALSFTSKASTERFWTWKLHLPILLAFSIAFFNQLSGVNAILYFAPRIFEMTGLGSSAALLQSVGIGIFNFIFTFAGIWLIDRLGRKTLLYIGAFGYITSLTLIGWAFHTDHMTIVPYCTFAFIASHAVGQGAVIWVFISEIFPNRFRAEGTSLGCSTHWIFAALITTFFPKAVSAFQPEHIFFFFAGMMVLEVIWIKTMVIETKGVPLEDIQKRLGISSMK